MKKIFCLLLSCIVFVGCSEKAPISKKKMEDFLVDYYALESALRHAERMTKNLDKNVVYADFIKDHGYTVAQVDSAFAYWGARPREYALIYSKVVKRLEQRRDEVTEELNR